MHRLLDRDLLTGLILLCIFGIFSADNSADPKDWIFPILANYVIVIVGVALFTRGTYALITRRLPDFIHLTPEERIAYFDVFVFFLIVLAYMFLMHGLGFWLSSFLMVSLTSIYLTLDKTRHNIGLAVAVPLGSCILFYFVFLHVFYVPFPRATWWPGLMPA